MGREKHSSMYVVLTASGTKAALFVTLLSHEITLQEMGEGENRSREGRGQGGEAGRDGYTVRGGVVQRLQGMRLELSFHCA